MRTTHLKDCAAYQHLLQIADKKTASSLNLKRLTAQADRFEKYSLQNSGIFYDYSKQRLDDEVLNELIALAREKEVKKQFKSMCDGKVVNATENRAALHTAARNYTDNTIKINGANISRQINDVNRDIKRFTGKVHDQTIVGSTGKPFTDAVIIGIGGSYLGCEFVYSALKVFSTPNMNLHFLPNVDIDNFGQIIKQIDPEKTLWIVISKSYTTTETMANLKQVTGFIKSCNINIKDHLVSITAKGSPGDDATADMLATFHMFDFIGGRYSVTSAVGGLPLSLAFGFDIFERFLKGCCQMDDHAITAPEHDNIPLLAALISIWNSHFLSCSAQAIIPYCSALSKLAPHVQQLYMESLGKSVTTTGDFIDYPSGVIIFGEPGTCAQHSFFQLAHQGLAFPIEFIGVVNPVYDGVQNVSKGVTNHQELWANMIAQARALAIGRTDDVDNARYCGGNRPSSTIIIEDLSPQNIGRLLSFYEARTVFEGFILDINPFDQFGVELGKVLASDIRDEVAKKNRAAGHSFDNLDTAAKFYLDLLFKKKL